MIIPNPKSYTDKEWDEIVREQGGFWHHMDDMMGVHLVEAAELILDQKNQDLLIDAIGDTMTKIKVLQTLLHEYQNQETLHDRGFDVLEATQDINSLRAGMNGQEVDKLEAAYRSMLARSQIAEEDKEHE